MTTPDAIGKYGQGLASAIEQLAHILGIRTWQAGQQSTMHTEAPRQRNIGPPGTNFTLLLVVNDTITLVWPLEENSCKAVLNAFTPLTATKVAAYGNDFGPAGLSGNFVIVKGTVNGQSASG